MFWLLEISDVTAFLSDVSWSEIALMLWILLFVDFNLEAGVSDRSIVRGFSLVVVLLLDGLGRLFLVVCLSLFFLLVLESAISCSVVILVWVGIDAEDEEDEADDESVVDDKVTNGVEGEELRIEGINADGLVDLSS